MTARVCSVEGCGRRHHARGFCSTHHYKLVRMAVAAPCAVEGCGAPVAARGWCGKHYQRWKNHGDPLGVAPAPKGCSVEGCTRRHEARGYCFTHYARWRKNGDLELRGRAVRLCSVDGCSTKHFGNGMCKTHYEQVRRPHQREHGRPCSIEGCPLTTHARTWCSKHYFRWKVHGDPLGGGPERLMTRGALCITEGCDRPGNGPAGALGLCARHYGALQRRRNPEMFKASQDRRRARKLGVAYENVIPSRVFERDGWTCHICGLAIDPSIKWPDVSSPSIDHVVPLVHGGSHTYANVAASHLHCNLKKYTHSLDHAIARASVLTATGARPA